MNQYEIVSLVKESDAAPIEVALEHTYLQTPESVHGKAALCATEDALRVHMELCCSEIRAVEEGPLGMPCQDSCMEFFFCPMPNDDRYFNFEWNANGCLFLGMGSSIADLTRLIVEEKEALFLPRIQRNASGWTLDYRIPYAFIRRFFPDFQPEGVIRGNFYACSDLSDPPYYLSWSPIVGDPFSYHRTECFGQLRFS